MNFVKTKIIIAPCSVLLSGRQLKCTYTGLKNKDGCANIDGCSAVGGDDRWMDGLEETGWISPE